MSRTARLPRRVLAPTALAVAAAACLVLSGCAAGQVSQTADQVAAIDGANGTVGDLTVLNARLAPTDPEGYAAGADARLLLWISNACLTNGDTLTAVTSPAAESDHHPRRRDHPAADLADFSGASGTRVTVTGFTRTVPYGLSIPMTFSFENAGSLDLEHPDPDPRRAVHRPADRRDPAAAPDAPLGRGRTARRPPRPRRAARADRTGWPVRDHRRARRPAAPPGRVAGRLSGVGPSVALVTYPGRASRPSTTLDTARGGRRGSPRARIPLHRVRPRGRQVARPLPGVPGLGHARPVGSGARGRPAPADRRVP